MPEDPIVYSRRPLAVVPRIALRCAGTSSAHSEAGPKQRHSSSTSLASCSSHTHQNQQTPTNWPAATAVVPHFFVSFFNPRRPRPFCCGLRAIRFWAGDNLIITSSQTGQHTYIYDQHTRLQPNQDHKQQPLQACTPRKEDGVKVRYSRSGGGGGGLRGEYRVERGAIEGRAGVRRRTNREKERESKKEYFFFRYLERESPGD